MASHPQPDFTLTHLTSENSLSGLSTVIPLSHIGGFVGGLSRSTTLLDTARNHPTSVNEKFCEKNSTF